MTLDISMFKNIFLLHTKIIPTCYAKFHNLNKFSLEKLPLLMNSVMLANSVRDTKYHKGCSTICLLIPTSHKGEQQFFGEWPPKYIHGLVVQVL